MTNSTPNSAPNNAQLVTASPSTESQRNPGRATPGRGKKPAVPEEKVPVTFSFSPEFARRLKVVVSASDESASSYVETRLASVVRKDLKQILEEMA